MIPADLRTRPQWVVWRFERRDGKRTKVPYNPRTGIRASATDPGAWADFETAVGVARQPGVDGVGFVFTADDPFCGVDLDSCVGDAQSLHPAAAEIVERLSSYTELSPSGPGVHVILRAKLPAGTRNRTSETPWGGTFEVYDRDPFFTMTGKSIELLPKFEVESRQQELQHPLAELFPGTESERRAADSLPPERPHGRGGARACLRGQERRDRPSALPRQRGRLRQPQ